MSPVDPLATLTDTELFEKVQRLTARSNLTLAELLVHLGEVEARGLHRTRACASLYTYCVYELRMSEDTAYRRSKAARLVREHPELRDAIAKGEIHLTGVLMIGPHLGGERHAEILERARFRSKRELLRLIAEIDPRPEVPARIEPLGPALVPAAPTHEEHLLALAGPVRHLPPGRRPGDWLDDTGAAELAEHADDSTDRPAPAGNTGARDPGGDTGAQELAGRAPARPLHYKVQLTASQEHVDLLQELGDLLGHERPRPSLPDIYLRALHALARELRVKKRAASTPLSLHSLGRAARGVGARRSALCLRRRARGAVPRDVRAGAAPSARLRPGWPASGLEPGAPVSLAQPARRGGRLRPGAHGLDARKDRRTRAGA
jgi:hypothetical protein